MNEKKKSLPPWNWRDAFEALLAGAAIFAAVSFLYWNLVVLLPDDMFSRSLDPLGKLAALRLALFLPIALGSGMLITYLYRRLAAHPGLVNLLPGAAFAASLFVLVETRWIQAPFPAWFILMRALILFLALPFGWWLVTRKWNAA